MGTQPHKSRNKSLEKRDKKTVYEILTNKSRFEKKISGKKQCMKKLYKILDEHPWSIADSKQIKNSEQNQ